MNNKKDQIVMLQLYWGESGQILCCRATTCTFREVQKTYRSDEYPHHPYSLYFL